jgi:hypothetical protein
MIVIRSMQDDDSLLRSFITIKPAAEKILSDGTDVEIFYRKPDRVSGKKF